MLNKCIFALSAISMVGCLATHKPNKNVMGMFENPQRRQKETLSSERIERLNELGFVWDVIEHQWEEKFRALKEYKKHFGHCLSVNN